MLARSGTSSFGSRLTTRGLTVRGKPRACAADLAIEQAMIVDDEAGNVTANRY